MQKILALDLGTLTGYCYGDPKHLVCGTWKLAAAKEISFWHKHRLDRRCDPRFSRLMKHLAAVRDQYTPEVVVWEDVEFVMHQRQAQLWPTWRAAIWATFDPEKVVLECVPVGTLKAFATGNGAATKEQMAKHFNHNGPERAEYDDNAIDAWHAWHWAKQLFSRVK